jgi:hypothetical protein
MKYAVIPSSWLTTGWGWSARRLIVLQRMAMRYELPLDDPTRLEGLYRHVCFEIWP